MEVEVSKPSGVQRSKEEIISILEEGRKSKLNVKEFVKTLMPVASFPSSI